MICSTDVTLINPFIEDVIAGADKLPLSIILVTMAYLESISDVKLALEVSEVIWVNPLTFIGLFIFQFCPLFSAKTEGIEEVPLLTIPCIIANELLINELSASVPENEEVTFSLLVTFINLSSLVIIRGVSKIIF